MISGCLERWEGGVALGYTSVFSPKQPSHLETKTQMNVPSLLGIGRQQARPVSHVADGDCQTRVSPRVAGRAVQRPSVVPGHISCGGTPIAARQRGIATTQHEVQTR